MKLVPEKSCLNMYNPFVSSKGTLASSSLLDPRNSKGKEIERKTMTSRTILISLGILLAAYASTGVTANGEESPKYGYTGSTGPDKWGSLSPGYKQCSDGSRQSPVNIKPVEASKASNDQTLERSYSSVVNHTVLVNTGSHIELRFQPNDGHATFNHSTYNVDYIRFHTPAEHFIDDNKYPLEVQIVHRDQDGKELIVSILHKLRNPDTFLYQLKDYLEKLASDDCGDDEEAQILVEKNLKTKNLKKTGGRYYGYVGSQTVPPCQEGVLWFISKKVRSVSAEQIKALQAPLSAEYQNNARPIFHVGAGNITKYED